MLDVKDWDQFFMPVYKGYLELVQDNWFTGQTIQTFLYRNKKEMARNLKVVPMIRNKIKEIYYRDLIYECLLHSQIEYFKICYDIYKRADLSFFLKYHDHEFLTVYFNNYLTQ